MKYVISIGGSLIVPDNIDINFLKKFRKTILDLAKKGNQFYIIPGGGNTARKYMEVARKISNSQDSDLDWVGIAVNKMHSEFLRVIFGNKAYKEVLGITKAGKVRLKSKIVVCQGGIAPGGTSDSASVEFAKRLGVRSIINFTNVNGVYDRDPRRHKEAKLIKHLSWNELVQKFGNNNHPGRNLPFDTSAAKIAKKEKMTVAIMNGKNLKNLKSYVSPGKFTGTTIS